MAAVGSGPLRNISGHSYRALEPEKQAWGDENWIGAFAEDAMLIKRPVFVRAGQVLLVGFRGSEGELLALLEPT